jgi:Gluconate 2-dehydrogenase subunit 3
MPVWLSEQEYATLRAACAQMLPSGEDAPGAEEAGVADYIDGFLGAFSSDPPRIWAGGPSSGRKGGAAGFGTFFRLSRLDELAWRMRIEGSQGIPEREFNGPVTGLQQRYREGLAALGADFIEVDGKEQRRRLRADAEFCDLLWEHCCEGMYGAPEYGGNRDGVGWAAIDYEGDVQPRGYSDAEVSQP